MNAKRAHRLSPGPAGRETAPPPLMPPLRGKMAQSSRKAGPEGGEQGGRIVAVGSTALRLLESAAQDDGRLHAFSGETAIFIIPGYKFRGVDLMFTNFHLPRSTLFMLVAAFSGLDTMKSAYVHAIADGYRFYSYGDACLLFPAAGAV